MRWGLLIIVASSLWIGSAAPGAQSGAGQKVTDVTLRALDGSEAKLLDQGQGKVLVIAYTGVGCPISNRYAPRLQELAEKYADKAVFIGVNANPQDDAPAITKAVAELGIKFPVFKDAEQALTEQLDARTTTEVFVLDEQRVIRYRGMIDDQYTIGAERAQPRHRHLEKAIRSALKGETADPARTAAPGCLLTRKGGPNKPATAMTYSSNIARIIQDNCQSCHRPEQIGPFPMTTYDEVFGWSAMIHNVVSEGRMPPWNADHAFDGQFVNQRKLAPADKQALLAWIEAGMPRGTPEQDPPPKEWPKRWRIGEPHKVFTVRDQFIVPKEGVVPYKFFIVPTDFKEDKWITAMEAQPDAEDVVHHIVVFIQEPGKKSDFSRLGLEDGFLCAQVPGDTPSIYPAGSAKRLPAGANLIFQVHYTTNGKVRRDRSRLGMIFADEPAKQEVKTRGIYNMKFEIPPGDADYEVRAQHTFAEDTRILSLFPHMHFRGKDFKFTAHYPDGKSETLLFVPRYNYNWQESYIYGEPKLLPAGTRLECIAHYDNSANNFANPDPTAKVKFGEQTWDEMMFGYMDYLN